MTQLKADMKFTQLLGEVERQGAVLEPAAIRWAWPPYRDGIYSPAPSRRAILRSLPANVYPVEAARPRSPHAAPPQTLRPYFGFQSAEAKRHVLWLCAPSGTGAAALPGNMTTTPFTLRPGCRISDPVQCVRQLRADVVDGPAGPRARSGALQEDLRHLYQMFAAP